MENQIVKIICGNYPKDFKKVEIKSDENYVFENDPTFESVRLFDTENNIVNVNSWLECANYVNGGWTNDISDFTNGEQGLFFVLLFLIFGIGLAQKKFDFIKRI